MPPAAVPKFSWLKPLKSVMRICAIVGLVGGSF